MLSISVIKASAQAVSYYEKDDYYAANGGEPDAQGQWFGKGAERLGLVGAVEREDFKAILEGRLPNGTVLGTKRDGELQHRPGWDLTWSAPKSVSVAAEVGGDERIIKVHGEAVREAVRYLEDNAALYRQRGFADLMERKGDNLVVALFQHDTSRNQDPQLHTHAVVANVIQREDGRWVSLHGDQLYELKMAAGNVYRAALSASLQKLGYEVERTHVDGRFEIVAVPEKVADSFATRREEIENALEKRGISGAEASAAAALMTRKSKTIIPREELTPEWRERGLQMGFDAAAAVREARAAGDVTPAQPFNIDRAVAHAIDRLSESEAVFTRGDLVRWTLANSMGRARVRDADAAIDRATRNKSLIATRLNDREAFTTPAAQHQENLFAKSLTTTQGTLAAPMTAREVTRQLAGSKLNESQRKAVSLIATSTDRYIGVLGRPGVGKTFMLGEARTLLESKGFQLRGMAANSEAARQIQKDSGIESSTLAKHLARANKDIGLLKKADDREKASILAKYEKTVWVIDEASQVDSSTMRRVAFAADKLGARVVMIGDTKQLAAIGAGKPFDLMLAAGMKHVEMDDIRRQNNAEHITAIRQVIAGDIKGAMKLLEKETRQVENKNQRLDEMLKLWRKAQDRAQTFMLTAKNVDKTQLNDGARDILRGEGKLKGEAEQQQLFRTFNGRADRMEAQTYREGLVVRFGRNLKGLDIQKGEYWKVVGTDIRRNIVSLEHRDDQGRTRHVDWNPKNIGGNAKRAAVEIYRPRDTTLAEGERIQWNRNSTDLKLSNGQVLTVEKIAGSKITLRTETGEAKLIDTQDRGGQHWEHAYATTIYKSQGGTASTVIVNAESGQSELFSQKAFLVAISRQKDKLTLLTDDAKKFADSVTAALGGKTSATESAAESRWHTTRTYLDGVLDSWRDLMKSPVPEQQRPPAEGGGGGAAKAPIQRELDR